MIRSVRSVGVAEVDDVFVVGISEERDGLGRSLLFQIPVDPDLVEEVDTYCISDERQAIAYGGVQSASIDGNTLRLTFDAEAAASLSSAQVVELELHVPARQVDRLRSGLRRIFAYGIEYELPVLDL